MVEIKVGFSQLLGEPSTGKSIFAFLMAQRFRHSVVLVTEPPGRLASLLAVKVMQVSSVGVAFELIYELQRAALMEFVALDDLASLALRHPGARKLSPDLDRALRGRIWTLPVLVVNQIRFPRPPGSSLFRSLLRQNIELRRLRPGMRDLVSEIWVDGQQADEYLVWRWAEPLPAIRVLSLSEREEWGVK